MVAVACMAGVLLPPTVALLIRDRVRGNTLAMTLLGIALAALGAFVAVASLLDWRDWFVGFAVVLPSTLATLAFLGRHAPADDRDVSMWG